MGASDWTRGEVAAVVADYLLMFRLFLGGQTFNRSAHRRRLQLRVARSDAAIEFKHRNTSAVLRDMGMQWLAGYAPASNYQRLLAQEVERQVAATPDIDRAALLDVERLAVVPEVERLDKVIVESPSLKQRTRESGGLYLSAPATRDYLAREARNRSLGEAGEHFVLKFEDWRLRAAGKRALAERIQHVAARHDAAGYDVLSFEESGQERFIEVKTTTYAKETPFFVSSAELEFGRRHAGAYRIYRLFDFRKEPRLFELAGELSQHCVLDPISFRASFG